MNINRKNKSNILTRRTETLDFILDRIISYVIENESGIQYAKVFYRESYFVNTSSHILNNAKKELGMNSTTEIIYLNGQGNTILMYDKRNIDLELELAKNCDYMRLKRVII